MSKEIQQILEEGEQVAWEGRQDLASSIAISCATSLGLLVFGGIFYLVSSATDGTCTINGQVRPAEDCAGVFMYVAFAALILAIFVPIIAYLRYLVTYYVITDKRALLKSGFIGADMRSVYYEQMRSAFVDVGIVGKIFGTGSILIDTGRMTQVKNGTQTVYDRLSNIKNPYDVYKLLQNKISNRKEGLHSGRADYESNKEEYKDFVQGSERLKEESRRQEPP